MLYLAGDENDAFALDLDVGRDHVEGALDDPLIQVLDGRGLQVQHHIHLRLLRAHVALEI